jgi:cell division protein FtsZ
MELENQPAYMRRNIQLDDVPGSSQNHLSNWSIRVGETGEPTLGENPSLHADVD